MYKLVFTTHSLTRALSRMFGKQENEIKPEEIVRMKLMLDKLITRRPVVALGNGAKVFLPIDEFDGFRAICVIEDDAIVVKTVSPITK